MQHTQTGTIVLQNEYIYCEALLVVFKILGKKKLFIFFFNSKVMLGVFSL